MKKFLSLLLASAMVVSAFAACTASTDSEGDTQGELNENGMAPVNITMLFPDNANDPFQEDWKYFDVVKDAANITFDVTVVPSADYETKKSLLINTGDIPDIIANSFPTMTQISSGLFMACDELEANMPTYTAYLEDNDLRTSIDKRRTADGHYYNLPCILMPDKYPTLGWQIRGDIFEKNNLEAPTNLDELYEVGMDLLEIYPDSEPLSNRFSSNLIMSGLAAGFGTTAGWTYEDGAHYDEASDSFIFAATTQNWKDMLIYTNKLYTDGVLDKEFSTLDSTTYQQKVIQGESFIFYNYFANIRGNNTDGKEVDPDYKYIPINSLKGTADYADEYAVGWSNQWSASWMIAASVADRKDYADFCKALDWFYTEDAMTLTSYGTEDMYQIDEYGFTDSLLPEGNGNTEGFANNSLCALKHPDKLYEGWGEDAALMKAVYEDMAANNAVDDPRPMSPLSTDEVEALSVTSTNLTDYVKTCMESFIFGTMTFDQWDEFVAQCESKGSQKLVDTYNEAWAAKA